jgi:hypothetical protein
MVLAGAAGCHRPSACVANGTIIEISGGPGHTALVTPADVAKGVGRTIPVSGIDHRHAFILSDADMEKLGRGEPVQTMTSSVNGHTHPVTIECKK